MRRLLWVGDAACDSGFARATHKTLETLRHHYDVSVLGVNYRGDPHRYPYDIYPARNVGMMGGGDILGISRIAEVTDKVRPDIVVVQNDPWHMEAYLDKLKQYAPYAKVVGAVAIDGHNCAYGEKMNRFDHAIFWTQFALKEAREGGYTQPATVIPLGVDLAVYHPGDRMEARRTLQLPQATDAGWNIENAFIFINVNRNQPRKRIDLTLRYFSQWLKANEDVQNAFLYLHVCPTGDIGVDIRQLAQYYGINKRVIVAEPTVYRGVSEDMLATTYRACNAAISTTVGEGFGLTTLEAMACGLPCELPQWSALEELFGDAAYMVDCTSLSITPKVNVIGGVPDEKDFVRGLDMLYRDKDVYEAYHKSGILKANETRFSWNVIGNEWLRVLETL